MGMMGKLWAVSGSGSAFKDVSEAPWGNHGVKSSEPDMASLWFEACSRADIESAQILLDAGWDIDASNSRGQTGLMVSLMGRAWESGHDFMPIDMARWLLERSARMDLTDMRGRGALYYAIEEDDAHGEDLLSLALCFVQGDEPWIHWDDLLVAAVEAGSSRSLIRLLAAASRSGASNAQTRLGASALEKAASKGRPDLVGILLSHGHKPSANSEGMDPLMAAAQCGCAESVTILLGLSDPMAQDDSGVTALMRAASQGSMACLMALLPLSNAQARAKDGSTALMRSARDMTGESCRLLLPYSDSGARNELGESALDIALRMSALGSACVLATSVMELTVDAQGWTELMRAAMAPMGRGLYQRRIFARAGYENSATDRGPGPDGRSVHQSVDGLIKEASLVEDSVGTYSGLLKELAAKPGWDRVDHSGCDALMIAIKRRNMEAFVALMPILALDRKDNQGRGCYELAQEHGGNRFAVLIERAMLLSESSSKTVEMNLAQKPRSKSCAL